MHETVSRHHVWVARIALCFWAGLTHEAQQVSKMSTWRFILREKHNFGSIKRHINQRIYHKGCPTWDSPYNHGMIEPCFILLDAKGKGMKTTAATRCALHRLGRDRCAVWMRRWPLKLSSHVCVVRFFQISDFTRLIKRASFGFSLSKISDKTNECLLWT